MKSHLKITLLACLACAAVAALAGFPIPPDVLAGLAGIGMAPFAMGTTDSTVSDLTGLIQKQGDSLETWKQKHDAKLAALEADMREVAMKNGRLKLGLGGAGPAADEQNRDAFYDPKTKASVPVLGRSQALADLDTKEVGAPSPGRVLRGIVMGGRADDAKELELERRAMSIGDGTGGGYTVNGSLAGEWIDLWRADMALMKAGARTIPLSTNSLTLARVDADPVVSWHGENNAITPTSPTLGSVTLTAKTAVCLVKFSLELSQDSSNIEQILESTITRAMAGAIDSCGLNGVATNAGAAPGGLFDLDGRNSVLSIGAPTTWDWLIDGLFELAADSIPMDRIGALIGHPAIWKKMRKLKTGIASDNTPLLAPDEVRALPKIWTTAAPLSGSTAKAVIGDWRDLLFGVRKDISVKVLQETFLGSNLQLALLVYARVDFAATRPKSFCTLEGITV